MIQRTVTNALELEALIEEIGFLPLFRSAIPGFSVEDCTSRDLWFVTGVIGPWEWREEIANRGRIAYGKLFDRKAGFVSRAWYPHLANYRRKGNDFAALYEQGLASHRNKRIVDLLTGVESLPSSELKRRGGFGKDGEKGYESTMVALQMQTYVTIRRFEYKLDRYGKPYGMGVGCYALSEEAFGDEFVTSAYDTDPTDSRALLEQHILSLNPDASSSQVAKVLG